MAVGLGTAALGYVAFRAEPDASALPWGIALPLIEALIALSPIWRTPQLAMGAAATGALAGLGVVAAGAPWPAGVVLAIALGAGAAGIVLGFRFSVWMLDVIREMDRTRGVELQLAVAEERLRFARDLHDVMGRNLSVIAVKSQLAGELVRRARPEAADEVAEINRVAQESLREVRDVVRGYRIVDVGGELAGARSVLRAAGVTCTVSGDELGAALPETTRSALGWVLREAVTNVLRHSRAS